MRTLILGCKGLLGTELKWAFSDFEPHCLDREDIDVTNEKSVKSVFSEIKPALVINATGFTNVDAAEDAKEEAMDVNGRALGLIAKFAKKYDAILVHYSTDYIFNGKKKRGYNEDDKPARKPMNVYGESKLLGEKILKKNYKKYYLIRTSWLFGPGGRDFIDTVIKLSERGEMKIKNDEHGKPTYAKDLAQATIALIHGEVPYGTYHIVNEGATTWYNYAEKIIELYGKKKRWRRKKFPKIIPVSSAEFPAPAKRPAYSILNNNKFIHLRPWTEALEEYLDEYYS